MRRKKQNIFDISVARCLIYLGALNTAPYFKAPKELNTGNDPTYLYFFMIKKACSNLSPVSGLQLSF